MEKPAKYDMSKPEDIKRWFLEMEGYLKCGSEIKTDFLNQGTDFDGRCFAMDGFRQLRVIMYKQINSETSHNSSFIQDYLQFCKRCNKMTNHRKIKGLGVMCMKCSPK